jgi:hypothetical protein
LTGERVEDMLRVLPHGCVQPHLGHIGQRST